MCKKRRAEVKDNSLEYLNTDYNKKRIESMVDNINRIIASAIEYGKDPRINTVQHTKLLIAMSGLSISDLSFMHFNVVPNITEEVPRFDIKGIGNGLFH